jgi:HEAT repeat protein
MAAQPNIAELVEKLPPTDREIEAQKAAEKVQQDPAKPPAKPSKEPGASKFTGPEPEVAHQLCDQVLAGGRESVMQLIALVRDPASPEFKNYKPEYFLHCLTLYVGGTGKEAQRKTFREVLTAELVNEKHSPAVQRCLVRELQWIGDAATVRALGRLLTDEALCDDAASALVAIGADAGDVFRKALPGAKGRCRLVIVQNLGVLRDAEAAEVLKNALNDEDRDVRLAAAWGLARIGDPNSVDLLIKAADVPSGLERITATQACLLLAENLAAAGRKKEAAKIYTHLQETRTDPKETCVREAAAQALHALAGQLF